MGIKISYFDQSTNTKKQLDIEDLNTPDFDESILRLTLDFREIKVEKSSNLTEPLATFSLEGIDQSNLAQYMTSKYQIAQSQSASRTHSEDENSENAEGNDYGNTPDSSRKGKSFEDDSDSVDFDDDENDRIKRLYGKMEKNEQSSDDELDYDYGVGYTKKGKKKQAYYNDMAYDSWYNRDNEDLEDNYY